MKVIFSAIVFITTILISISLLPPPLTSDARAVTSITISTIRNSCIVNNANIAVQNVNITPLDAINNWWGMPTGATHDNTPSGDAVGLNVLHAPHLPTMPFLCDLSDADWIPFSEQDLQNAINSHIPYLGGIAFALIDFEWGSGAKFDIITHPNYDNLYDVAYISIKPNPTGDLITLQLDITRLPTDETVRQIVTCELVPLFVNSLQQVQNRYVSPSQNITSMVVMERDLMMRFSPPTEITPEPTPEFVLNYDASCLPMPIPQSTPTPTPTSPQNEDESGLLFTIPPLEGEFELSIITPIENNLSALSEPTIEIVSENPCPDDAGWCDLLEQGDVFTYVDFNQLISINRIDDVIIEFRHILPAHITNPTIPSWGVVDAETHHYRLAFNCTAIGYANRLCYWDSIANDYYYNIDNVGSGVISPDGRRIAKMGTHTIWIWDLEDNSYTAQQNLRDENGNPLSPIGSVRWSDANTIYYSAFPFGSSSLNQQEIWRYDLDTTSNTKIIEPDTTNYRVPIPLYFDVRSNNLLYWMRNFAYSDYSLNYLGNWSYTSPDFTYYGVYWSPRASENRAIGVKTNSENANQYCIDTFQTAFTPTHFNRIICRQMLFGFVDWATDVNLMASNSNEVCLGRIRIGSWGFRKNPSEDAVFEPTGDDPYIRNAPQINVLGTNGTWYYIEYNQHEGWVVGDAVEIIEEDCEVPLGVDDDSTGDLILTEVIYDYQLQLPQGFWSLRDEQIAIPDWASNSIEAKEDAKDWAYTYCQGGKHPQYWQPCSMIVFAIYYQLFEQIYGSPPIISDILATGYEVEVKPFTQRGMYDLAEEALAGHYFQIVREYCYHVLNIGEDISDVRIGENGCYNHIVPSEALVLGWRRKDYTDNYNNQGYFWTLQAWYAQAICLREWYFGKQGEAIPDRTQITQLSELKGICDQDRPHILLASASENKNIGLQQLTIDKALNARFLDWANYAYDNATHNGYLADFENSSYNRAIRLWMVPEVDETDPDDNPEYPIQMEHCQINLTYGETIRNGVRVTIWGEDVLAVIAKNGISGGLGNASTYDMLIHPRPAWLDISSELAKFTSIYRTCPCTTNNQRLPGTNFPFETRCNQ